jgi:hypothetical protein
MLLRFHRRFHAVIFGWVALAAASALVALPATAFADTANFVGASSDGSRVFFDTPERLVAADTDSSTDIYQRAAGVTTLISTGPNGGNGANEAFFNGASADGSRVFFRTTEKLVTPADADSSFDVYQRTNGTATTLISTGPNGGNGAQNATFEGASDDGGRVFFITQEKLVTPDDNDSAIDVYQRSGTTTTLLSTGPNGGNGAQNATFEGASADGSRVFFTTDEKLVTAGTPADGDSQTDVYQRSGSTTTLISTGPNGGSGANGAFFDGASADGSRVFFRTTEKLVTPADADSSFDVYQRTNGTATTLISTGPNGGSGANEARFLDASADGSRVFFRTTEKLVTPDDGDSSIDIYQRQGHVVTLISRGPNGGNGAFEVFFQDASSDGSRVFFTTTEKLVTATDRDTSFDIYQRAGNVTTLISTGPSGGNGPNSTAFRGASADGSRVFFQTDEKLVTPADGDTDFDIYQRFGTQTTLVSIAGDTDTDGVLDPADNCALVANAAQTNTDGDSQGDACDADDDNDGVADGPDNCELVPNPGQADSDFDGQGDACDGDTDGDGVLDPGDNCPGVANAAQTDTDGDLAGDACDLDDDADGVADGSDNCSLVVNADQANNDGDGLGDACDADDDNDAVADGSDNCSLVPNTTQTNSDVQDGGDACDPDDDNDGLTDFIEALRHTKRLDQDSDDDGLSDAREVNKTKTKPLKFDTDGDGISDGVELGLRKPIADPPGAIVATSRTKFRRDLDPKTKTKPRKKDTDGDKLADGREDRNRNGRKDKGETNPLKKDTDGDGFNDRVDKKPLNKHKH